MSREKLKSRDSHRVILGSFDGHQQTKDRATAADDSSSGRTGFFLAIGGFWRSSDEESDPPGEELNVACDERTSSAGRLLLFKEMVNFSFFEFLVTLPIMLPNFLLLSLFCFVGGFGAAELDLTVEGGASSARRFVGVGIGSESTARETSSSSARVELSREPAITELVTTGWELSEETMDDAATDMEKTSGIVDMVVEDSEVNGQEMLPLVVADAPNLSGVCFLIPHFSIISRTPLVSMPCLYFMWDINPERLYDLTEHKGHATEGMVRLSRSTNPPLVLASERHDSIWCCRHNLAFQKVAVQCVHLNQLWS